MDKEQNIGYLIVNVATARGAIPVGGAAVTVYDADSEGRPIVASVITDSSGKTPKLALAAPDRSISMQPGTTKPYASYLVEIEKEGYYTVTNSGVPVFSGITSIQPVDLIPLSESDSQNIYPRSGLNIPENENQMLEE